eukprot:CAMPEP_0197575288 /NCGR_PEP_ID=MMETSP1326-20131121/736_1 /TAXON_ID=1155430 /ORGANISM="Genus nov. species nov., Strain RCC2288" /LENGTH=352 /DNA_ID=CAMNT_0043138027 /DNA_START=221 /DNA_END=1276 /DNA_ORIENTATION=-
MPWWLRLVFMFLAMRGGDNVESTLQQMGYMMLSWSMREFFNTLQKPIMMPKLVRMGKMHPEVARQNKMSIRKMLKWLVLTSGVAGFLLYTGVVRMTFFLIFTTLILPLFRTIVFPWIWPVAPFLGGVCYMTWRWEGVQELFLGLVLFQALPTSQELLTHYLGRRSGAFLGFCAWVTTAVLCAPIVATFTVAMFAPELLESFVKERSTPEVAPYWALCEYYQSILGFSTSDGVNPYQVLGLPQTATERQIKKRFRDLSLKYHPDKTGNDPKKKDFFMKLQSAMALITQGTFDGPANENAMRERLHGTIQRTAELTPIIAIWLVLALLALLSWMVKGKSKEQAQAEQMAADRAA